MAEAVTATYEMDDEEYIEFVRMQPAEDAIRLMMRESRFVAFFFPPYSTGATGMIDAWMSEMKVDWESPKPKPEPILNRLAEDADFFGYGGPLREAISE